MKAVVEALMSRYVQLGAEGARIYPDQRSFNGKKKPTSAAEYNPKNDPYAKLEVDGI